MNIYYNYISDIWLTQQQFDHHRSKAHGFSVPTGSNSYLNGWMTKDYYDRLPRLRNPSGEVIVLVPGFKKWCEHAGFTKAATAHLKNVVNGSTKEFRGWTLA